VGERDGNLEFVDGPKREAVRWYGECRVRIRGGGGPCRREDDSGVGEYEGGEGG
jgi:hypothetical protein